MKGVSVFKSMFKQKDGRLILAEGEVTGHNHSIAPGVASFEEDEFGVEFLRAEKGAEVVHQEHRPITLPADDYTIGIVREQDHFQEEARNVAD